jgi:hypothetical protein
MGKTPHISRARLVDDVTVREDREIVRRVIVKCFSASEMAYLTQQIPFHRAVSAMKTFDDFEEVVTVGQRLPNNRDVVQSHNAIISSRLQT